MACINRINGLKDFQHLSYEEKQKLIEEEIRIYVEEEKANSPTDFKGYWKNGKLYPFPKKLIIKEQNIHVGMDR